MAIETFIPQTGKKEKTVKDLIFSILIESEPKSFIQLQREIKKRYHLSFSFQAIRKAVNNLLERNILTKEKREYSLNKDWIVQTRNFFDKLYADHFKIKRSVNIEVGKDVAVYTVNNLLELDRLWNDLITNWAREEKEDKRNVWKGRHCWWLIARLQEEDSMQDLLIKNSIKTYNLITTNSLLDRISKEYYFNKKRFCKINTKIKLKSDIHISAFGDNLLKFEIPTAISKKLEKIYEKTKKNQDLNLKEVLEILKEKNNIEIVVIKDKSIADKMKEDIISYFE